MRVQRLSCNSNFIYGLNMLKPKQLILNGVWAEIWRQTINNSFFVFHNMKLKRYTLFVDWLTRAAAYINSDLIEGQLQVNIELFELIGAKKIRHRFVHLFKITHNQISQELSALSPYSPLLGQSLTILWLFPLMILHRKTFPKWSSQKDYIWKVLTFFIC